MKGLCFIILIGFLLTFTSCFVEDDPVPPYVSPPGVVTAVAEMGPYYAVQLFYDLESNEFVRVVDRESWDLAFECGAGESKIYLNSSKMMKIGHTGETNFNADISLSNIDWRYDSSGGWEDSTAIGDWGTLTGTGVNSHNYVYVVDRGSTVMGDNIGMKKLQIISLADNIYTIRCSNLDGTGENTIALPKNAEYNYIFFSFNGGGTKVEVEPKKTLWDIQFTQYTALVKEQSTGIYQFYSVNGVLLNPYLVEAARDFVKPFTEITYTDLPSYTFSSVRDLIGYDWKVYDFDLSTYVIYPNRVYLVKDVAGNYFKIRFTSFTNAQGIRGYPTFEVAKF